MRTTVFAATLEPVPLSTADTEMRIVPSSPISKSSWEINSIDGPVSVAGVQKTVPAAITAPAFPVTFTFPDALSG